MAALGESGPDSSSDDPFERLGLSRDAGFDQVQAAKVRCLDEASGDDQARARIEAAYDAVLMARLRDRQQGQVSAAAATASEREASAGSMPSLPAQAPMTGVFATLRNKLPDPSQSLSGLKLDWALVEGQGRSVRIIAGIIGVALLVLSASSIQLVLALATIGAFLSQIRRGRRPLASLGWTLLVLSIGLAAGSLLNLALSPTAIEQLGLNPLQIQALPAGLLLMLSYFSELMLMSKPYWWRKKCRR